MALRGTLGDFGIADIFQLVGYQTKTGVLTMKQREEEVRIYFVDGNVVRADHAARDRSSLLGSRLVRAQVITAEQLEAGLTAQQRTLRRLGDLLVEMGALSRDTLRQMARLQTTETIYRLFLWTVGTYEFTQQPVEWDENGVEPIRAETLLMEGFRILDEWPAVRKRLPTSKCTLQVIAPLPDAVAESDKPDKDPFDDVSDAFSGMDEPAPRAPKSEASGVTDFERVVFDLVNKTRTVQDIIDLSRLGEFETCKAIVHLVEQRHLKVLSPSTAEIRGDGRTNARAFADSAVPVVVRVALFGALAMVFGGVIHLLTDNGAIDALLDRGARVSPRPVEAALGELQRARVLQALEVFRLREGHAPATLQEVLSVGALDESDLRFPYSMPYEYRAPPAAPQLTLPLR